MGKTCKRCGEEKPVGEFNRNAASKDGLNYYCRACQKALSDESRRRVKNREAKGKRDDYMKSCYRCREDKPASSFHLHGGHADGRTRICRACYREIGVVEGSSERSGGRAAVPDRAGEGLETAVLAG